MFFICLVLKVVASLRTYILLHTHTITLARTYMYKSLHKSYNERKRTNIQVTISRGWRIINDNIQEMRFIYSYNDFAGGPKHFRVSSGSTCSKIRRNQKIKDKLINYWAPKNRVETWIAINSSLAQELHLSQKNKHIKLFGMLTIDIQIYYIH